MKNQHIKIILIHGNGRATVNDHWFPWIKKRLEKLGLIVIAENFPDALLAREKYWLPFIEELGADENTILVGHSSGAVAALRYAEKHKILGSALIGANYTDFGKSIEKISGYYNRPWDWQAIRNNQQWILQFASTDDPCVPIVEPQHIHKHLESIYFEYKDKGHFMIPTFPDLLEALEKVLPK